MPETTTIEQRLQQFSEHYSRNKLRYMRFAQSFVRDTAAVEDIVNKSVLSLLENKDTYTDSLPLETYFHAIIKNNCRDWLRNKQTQIRVQKDLYDTANRLLEHDLCALEEFDPASIITGEIETILQQQLAKMPNRTRICFEENRFNGMTYQQIAQKYNITVRIVTREIQAALSILRCSLKDYLILLSIIVSCNFF